MTKHTDVTSNGLANSKKFAIPLIKEIVPIGANNNGINCMLIEKSGKNLKCSAGFTRTSCHVNYAALRREKNI